MFDDLFPQLGRRSPRWPLEAIEELVALRRTLDRVERLLIAEARRQAWTWDEIGEAHGTNRQAVRRRAPPELLRPRPQRPPSPLDAWTVRPETLRARAPGGAPPEAGT